MSADPSGGGLRADLGRLVRELLEETQRDDRPISEAIHEHLGVDGIELPLLELYARGLELDGVELEAVVTRAEGFTASFFRELLRKATLASVSEGRPTVTGADIDAALDELMAENAALTRVLLGSGAPGALAAPEPHEWMQQSGAHQTVMLTSRPQGGTVS